MLAYGFLKETRTAALGIIAVAVETQPRTHGIAGGEKIGMTLGVHRAASATHRKPHNGTMGLVADGAITLFKGREEFGEEEILISSSGQVEIAVPHVHDVRTTSVGHDDDHRRRLAALDEFVGNRLHLSAVSPSGVVVGEAVEKIYDGVTTIAILEMRRQIDVANNRSTEHTTLNGVGHDAASVHGERTAEKQDKK